METKILNATIIAGNVHRLRLAANLTQSELAQKLHVSTSSVNAWEKEKTESITEVYNST
jgi:DNA-binding XRE family transcriptional regulator